MSTKAAQFPTAKLVRKPNPKPWAPCGDCDDGVAATHFLYLESEDGRIVRVRLCEPCAEESAKLHGLEMPE